MLTPGFADPVHHAQRVFRALLHALAHPGRSVRIDVPPLPVALPASMALSLLALADDSTAVWWQSPALSGTLAPWLRFHTGAPAAAMPADASFAVIDAPSRMPLLADFALGSASTPERSTTLLLAARFGAGAPTEWHGPGIRGSARVQVDGLGDGFWAQWNENYAAFPQGVDAVLCCDDSVIGMPRTTRVRQVERV
jgi:alpha-D-ribose 1-methylphosphonate 5-triphosphate synthase subunit PhnH